MLNRFVLERDLNITNEDLHASIARLDEKLDQLQQNRDQQEEANEIVEGVAEFYAKSYLISNDPFP